MKIGQKVKLSSQSGHGYLLQKEGKTCKGFKLPGDYCLVYWYPENNQSVYGHVHQSALKKVGRLI